MPSQLPEVDVASMSMWAAEGKIVAATYLRQVGVGYGHRLVGLDMPPWCMRYSRRWILLSFSGPLRVSLGPFEPLWACPCLFLGFSCSL